MKLYAASLMAVVVKVDRQTIDHVVLVFAANNDNEARRFAMNHALNNSHPPERGFVNHSISVCEVPMCLIHDVVSGVLK